MAREGAIIALLLAAVIATASGTDTSLSHCGSHLPRRELVVIALMGFGTLYTRSVE